MRECSVFTINILRIQDGDHIRGHLPDLLREMWQEDATRSQEGEKHFCYLYIFLSGNTWNESGFGVNDNSQSKEFSLSH